MIVGTTESRDPPLDESGVDWTTGIGVTTAASGDGAEVIVGITDNVGGTGVAVGKIVAVGGGIVVVGVAGTGVGKAD